MINMFGKSKNVIQFAPIKSKLSSKDPYKQPAVYGPAPTGQLFGGPSGMPGLGGTAQDIGIVTLLIGGSAVAYAILGPVDTWFKENVQGLKSQQDYKWIAKRNAMLGGAIGVFFSSMYLIGDQK